MIQCIAWTVGVAFPQQTLKFHREVQILMIFKPCDCASEKKSWNCCYWTYLQIPSVALCRLITPFITPRCIRNSIIVKSFHLLNISLITVKIEKIILEFLQIPRILFYKQRQKLRKKNKNWENFCQNFWAKINQTIVHILDKW